MDESRITPSRWYYVLATVIFVAGLASCAAFLYKNLSGMGDRLQQVVAPGHADLNLREPGVYTIFYEYQSVIGDKVYSTEENLSGLQCAVAARTGNRKIPLSRSVTRSTYQWGERSGRSVFEFKIDHPGVYTLSSAYAQDQAGPEVVLAVGKGFVTGLVTTIFGAFAIVFGSLAMAIAVAVVTLIKRSNCRKRAARQASPAC